MVERALIGAQGADLVRYNTAAELVFRVVRLDGLISGELVHAGPRSQHATSKCRDEAIALTVVMAVRQQDRMWPSGAAKRLDASGRGHRVEQDS
jgi:hypothetical protein